MANLNPIDQTSKIQRPRLAAGQRYGRLLTLEPTHQILSSGRKLTAWKCRCDCGKDTTVLSMFLPNGHTRSCGCLAREQNSICNRIHGRSGTPEYRIWSVMNQRCYKTYSPVYQHYGARGIKVCNRWRFGENGQTGFECFITDIGLRPHKGLTLDRINNDGNYEPNNCRWATWAVQQNNRRKAKPRPPATHCRQGHALSTETAYQTRGGLLRCKKCQALRQSRYEAKKRAAVPLLY